MTSAVRPFTKKPVILSIINVIYFLIPIYYGFIYCNLVVNNSGNLIYNTFFFLFTMTFGSLFIAISLIKISKVSWYAIIVHSALVFIHNIVALFNPLYNSGTKDVLIAVLFQILMLALILYFIAIRKKYRVLFFQPRLRWWEAKHRFEVNSEGAIHVDDASIQVLVVNVSVGGVRFSCSEKLPLGLIVNIVFKKYGVRINCKAELLWEEDNIFGAKFVNLSLQDKKQVRKLVTVLKKGCKRESGR